jgi:broad specificity phosphatase PhoE
MALASFYAKGSQTVEIHLARHGETEANVRRVFQGQSGVGLSERGRAQAAALGRRLRTVPYRALWTSDLERAHETATILASHLPAAVPIETDVGLREVDVGTWTGKSHDEVAALYPEEWSAWESGLDVRRGGGETYAELAERMESSITRICTRIEHGPVLIVSHGGSIKSFVAKILTASPEGIRALAVLENTSLTRVVRTGKRYRLVSWNDAAHLEG